MTTQSGNRVVLRPSLAWDGVKVFTASQISERQQLGDKITSWMAANPSHQVTEIVLTQSSDSAFHCLTFTVFYRSGSR